MLSTLFNLFGETKFLLTCADGFLYLGVDARAHEGKLRTCARGRPERGTDHAAIGPFFTHLGIGVLTVVDDFLLVLLRFMLGFTFWDID